MTTVRLVQLNSGYAIQRKECWLDRWEFCETVRVWNNRSVEYGETWSSLYIEKYCILKSIDEAEVAMQKTIDAIKAKNIERENNRKERKKFKVVKVIKKARV